jgi:DNA primase
MSDFAQIVKQQADIVKVIGEYVRLKKAGAQNYSGLCPFHKEKSPSFSVHAVRQFYHCFGCGASGDVFSFVGKIENVGFPEAIRIVAAKSGIALPKREYNSPEEARESRQRGKLLELHEQATLWFEEQLRSPEGSIAREYLSSRGLIQENIAAFRIGYAPDNFNALRERLQSVADAEALRLSGLFSFKEQEDGSAGPLYSRFRKRITFPIANESGRVIAFTARALDTGDKAGPKYMNSPETPLYSKGHVLFNLGKAKQAIRQHDFAILVEGQMDCISVYGAGIQNVLATSGTAFTEHQVNLLKRFTSKVVVNFDPDAAGANAAEKSIVLLTEEGFEIKVVTLEDGLDPDRYIREKGAPAYISALRAARRQQDYLIDRARQLFPGRTAETKVKALNFLLPHIRRMPNRLTRDEFAADAAQKLGIDSAVLRDELKQAAARRRDQIVSPTLGVSQVERLLLRAFCAEAGDPAFLALDAAISRDAVHFEGLNVYPLIEALRHRGSTQPIEAAAEGRERALLAQILLEEGEPVTLQEAEFALENLRVQFLEARQRALRSAISDAERKGDWGLLATLTAEKLSIDRELRTVGAG